MSGKGASAVFIAYGNSSAGFNVELAEGNDILRISSGSEPAKIIV